MASTETIRRVSIRGDGADSLNALRDALLGVSRAQSTTAATSDSLGSVTERTARKVTSSVTAFEGVERRTNALASPMQRFAKDLNAVISVVEAGGVEMGRVGGVIDALKSKLQSLGTVGAISVDQSGLNALLGIADAAGKSARDAADVFDAELTRMEEIARLRSAQAGEAFRDGLNRSLGVGAPSAVANGASFSALEEQAQRLAAIEQARAAQGATTSQQGINDLFGIGGRSASQSGATFSAMEEAARLEDEMAAAARRLRMEIDPLGAAFDRLQAEIAQYNALATAGVITQEELGTATILATTRFDEAAAHIKAVGRAGQMTTGQLVNMQYQLNDVIVSAVSGQNLGVVAMQQGMQFAQGFGPGTSLAQVGTSLSAGFASMLTPVNLAVVGVAALAGGVSLLWDAFKSEAPTVEDLLERQADLIRDISNAYGDAAKGVDVYMQASAGMLAVRSRAGIAESRTQLRGGAFDVLGNFGAQTYNRGGPGSFYVNGEFSAFDGQIQAFVQSVRSGRPDVERLVTEVTRLADLDPTNVELQKTAARLYGLVDPLRSLQAQIEAMRAGVLDERADSIRDAEISGREGRQFAAGQRTETWARRNGVSGVPVPGGNPARDPSDDFRGEVTALKAAEDALRGAQNRLSNAGLDAYSKSLAEINQRYDDLIRKEAEAGRSGAVGTLNQARAAELVAAAEEVETAWARSMEQYSRQTEIMAGEAAVLGKSTYEIEHYRAAMELLTRARENDGKVTAEEIALIEQEASSRARAAEAVESARQRLEETQALQQTFGEMGVDLFKGMTQGADGFADALRNVLDRMSDLILQAVLMGQGPLAGLFGLQGQNGSVGGLFGMAFGNKVGPLAPPGAANANVAGAPSPVALAGAPVAPVSVSPLAPLGSAAAPVAVEVANPLAGAASWVGTTETGSPGALSAFFQQAGFNLDPRQTAWCAAFANASLAQQGFQGTGSLSARSFMDWGEAVDPANVRPGDVAVFDRPAGGPNAGHVGFFDRYNEDGSVRFLAGNQGNAVDYGSLPMDRLLGFRRPTNSMGTTAGAGLTPIDETVYGAQEQLTQSVDALASSASTFQSGFGSSLSGIAESTASIGTGFTGQFGSALSNMVASLQTSGTGSGGGFFGSLFSGFGSLFGGGLSDPGGLIALGAYAEGGYTGPGGRNDPAGIVHAGEYVFDAESVRRIGIGNLDRMRGYANGGYVQDNIPTSLRDGGGSWGGGSSGSPGGDIVAITVEVKGARGNKEIEEMVDSGVTKGLKKYDEKVLPTRVPGIVNKGRQRGAIGR